MRSTRRSASRPKRRPPWLKWLRMRLTSMWRIPRGGLDDFDVVSLSGRLLEVAADQKNLDFWRSWWILSPETRLVDVQGDCRVFDWRSVVSSDAKNVSVEWIALMLRYVRGLACLGVSLPFFFKNGQRSCVLAKWVLENKWIFVQPASKLLPACFCCLPTCRHLGINKVQAFLFFLGGRQIYFSK